MSKGWIKLHRQLLNKSYFKNPKKLSLWILLLLKANHEPRKERFGGKTIICNPGQFTTGRKQLADELGMSESAVNRTLNHFEKIEQQIEQQTSTTNRLISIVNWDKYQISDNKPNNGFEKSGQQSEHTIRRKETNTSIVKQNLEKNEKDFEFGGNHRRRGEELFANRIIQGIEAANKQREGNSQSED